MNVHNLIHILQLNFEFSILLLDYCICAVQESRPQDEGKAKVRQMIENFKKKCMEKVTRKDLDPAEFKQGTCTIAITPD